jgi:phosphoserine phosphatase
MVINRNTSRHNYGQSEARGDHDIIPTEPPAVEETAKVLFVDLDGTLIQTDLFHESILLLLKQSIGLLLRAILRLRHGRAAFKRAVSEAVTPEIRKLPFRTEVLDFLSEQRLQGRKIVLATAADCNWAQSVAKELGMFDGILASDGANNLKGTAKLEAIQAFCREHRYTQFDYTGNNYVDLPILRKACGVYIVAPSPSLLVDGDRVMKHSVHPNVGAKT